MIKAISDNGLSLIWIQLNIAIENKYFLQNSKSNILLNFKHDVDNQLKDIEKDCENKVKAYEKGENFNYC